MINAWAGVAVFIVATAVVVWWWFRSRQVEAPGQTPPPTAAGRRATDPRDRQRDGGRRAPAPADRGAKLRGYETSVLVVSPGAEQPAQALGLRRGRRAGRPGGGSRRACSAYARTGSRRAARWATRIPCRRSRTQSAPSGPTRSSSRPTPRAGRTGSSGASSTGARERFAVPITPRGRRPRSRGLGGLALTGGRRDVLGDRGRSEPESAGP